MPLRLIEGQYAPGDPFCVDLATDDVQAAAQFYGRVFGWEFEGTGHLKAIKNGRMAAGIGLMDPLGLGSKMWWVCLASPEPAAGARKAEELGATVRGPQEVEQLGQIATVKDPSGASFALWQPKNINPGALHGAHGGIVWAELLTDDPPTAAAFYEKMYGVKAVPVEGTDGNGPPAGTLHLERQEIGVKRVMASVVPLGGHSTEAAEGPLRTDGASGRQDTHPRWRAYFMIEDTQVFSEDARAAGAELLESRVAASGQAVTVFRDPQGVEFAVVEGTAATGTQTS